MRIRSHHDDIIRAKIDWMHQNGFGITNDRYEVDPAQLCDVLALENQDTLVWLARERKKLRAYDALKDWLHDDSPKIDKGGWEGWVFPHGYLEKKRGKPQT